MLFCPGTLIDYQILIVLSIRHCVPALTGTHQEDSLVTHLFSLLLIFGPNVAILPRNDTGFRNMINRLTGQ